jgi:hypothetical protein
MTKINIMLSNSIFFSFVHFLSSRKRFSSFGLLVSILISAGLCLAEEPRSFVIDVEKCAPETKQWSLDFGSAALKIVGPDEGDCLVQVYNEIEGGYRQRQCRLPKKLLKVAVTPSGTDLQGFPAEACTILKQGNLFEETNELKEPGLWFSCASNNDCVFVPTYCAYTTVNRNYVGQFIAWDSRQSASIGPLANCLQRMNQTKLSSVPRCDKGKCVLQPREAHE